MKHKILYLFSTLVILSCIFLGGCGNSNESEVTYKTGLFSMTEQIKEECLNARVEKEKQQQVSLITNTPTWWPKEVPYPESGEFDYNAEISGIGTIRCTDKDIDAYEKKLVSNEFPEMKPTERENKYPSDEFGTKEIYSNGTYDVLIWRPGESGYGEINIFDSVTQQLSAHISQP